MGSRDYLRLHNFGADRDSGILLRNYSIFNEHKDFRSRVLDDAERLVLFPSRFWQSFVTPAYGT